MRLGRLFWKLVLGNAALLALVMVVGVWFALAALDRFHSQELTPYLRSHALMLRELMQERPLERAALQSLVARMAAADGKTAVRITVIDASGQVLADSQWDPQAMEPHRDRPEVRQALQLGEGESTRTSATVGEPLKYFAVRLGPVDAPQGVLRLAVPFQPLAERASFARTLLWPLGLIVLVSAIVLAAGLGVLWSGRVRRLTRAAQGLARGDLSTRIDDPGNDEIAALGRSLNRMRDRLAHQLSDIDRHRDVLGALLARLAEGVIVARPDGRVVLLNAEAARLLNRPELPWNATGRGPTVEECVPQHDLQRLLLGDIQRHGEPVARGPDPADHNGEAREARLELQGPSGAIAVLARASELSIPSAAGGADSSPARLLVMTDVTDLTKAAKMRSDFVANASHELRTPLSAIRGAVQTLLSMDLAREPQAAGRFLQMIQRHSSRLEAMVADLLELSRLESPGKRFVPISIQMQRVCDDLLGRWKEALSAKGLRWEVDLQASCRSVTANAHLLHLVLDNLVDNAIKFTDPGGCVRIECGCEEHSVSIAVVDTGCGIPTAEQDRVFERFYQVAAARSELDGPEKRGTGLGLSIVRHAVAAMGGTVHLHSLVDLGTTVTVTIPRPPSEVVST